MQLVQTVKGGGNPMAVIQQMAPGNPQMQQAMQMMQGKNPQQLRQMAENLAKERGTTLEDMTKQIQQMGISPSGGGMK